MEAYIYLKKKKPFELKGFNITQISDLNLFLWLIVS